MNGRWGWRPLTLSLFISVFVVACNVVSNISSTITPTEVLRVTLTLLQPRGPTETPTPRQSQSTPAPAPVTPGGDISKEALPELLDLEPPRCYAETPQTTVCLGLVNNPLPQTLQRVSLRIAVETYDSELRAERVITLEQALILPNTSAPYRSSFPVHWSDNLMSAVSLVSVELALDQSSYMTLVTEAEQGESTAERYSVSATIYNPGPDAAVNIRAIVMLLESDGSVAGYRVVSIDNRLSQGERMPLRIDIVPYSRSRNLNHYLYVEAQREPIENPE